MEMAMLETGITMASADALRSYIVALRQGQGYSQDTVADRVGMARRTYIAWETGEIKDIKAPVVIRAIKFLGGAFKHLAELDDVTEEEAAKKARDWLSLTSDQRAQEERIQAKFRRVIELGEQEPERLEQVIERLRSDARADPAILDVVMAYLDGRRSR
jgi:DNA-binding XRE family transcriptional regulator